MEYIKVSRVIVRVRNSLVAKCPWQAEMILAASLIGRCPQKVLQVQAAWAGGDLNFRPWFIVFTIPCAISERLVVHCGQVALGSGGAGRALVCALRPRAALVLLFRPCTGGHCGGGCGGGASLFLKVCDNDGDIAHSHCQLLCSAPVHIFQSGPESTTTGNGYIKLRIRSGSCRHQHTDFMTPTTCHSWPQNLQLNLSSIRNHCLLAKLWITPKWSSLYLSPVWPQWYKQHAHARAHIHTHMHTRTQLTVSGLVLHPTPQSINPHAQNHLVLE